MLTDVLLLLGLFLLNGALALSEIAIVSARRARLSGMADAGSAGARRALALAAEPTRFLSTVQIGITAIGILSGAIGEAALAAPLRGWIERSPVLSPYAGPLALAAVVAGVTYVSLIVGELVPKRLALTNPERFAALVARPMDWLARVSRPLVLVLTASTDAVLGVFRVPKRRGPTVSLEEIKVLLEQGTHEGVVEPAEREMMTNVLDLGERRAGAALTPRSEVVFLDVRDSADEVRRKLREHPHDVLPLCDGGLDRVLGFVRATQVLGRLLDARELDLPSLAEPALFVPETTTLMTLLERFRSTRLPVALVVDEFGDVEGLVSLSDVVVSVIGEMPSERGEEPMIVRRDDGTWLFDGGVDLDLVARTLDAPALVSEDERRFYHTLGGLVMLAMDRVPRTGDVFERAGYRFEVIDMDGNRVDRVLVSRIENRT